MIELTNQNTEWGNNELAEPSGKDRFWHKADFNDRTRCQRSGRTFRVKMMRAATWLISRQHDLSTHDNNLCIFFPERQ